MLRKFIERPILSTVVAIITVILGAIGLTKLPVEQFPDIAPPAIQVTATYPGANAETILRSVAPSLEEAINGVENMTYMSSIASNDGTLAISVFFKQGTNPDQASVNVQNRVSQALSQLPPEVIQQGVVTQKQQNSLISCVGVFSTDPKKYDRHFVANYTYINLIPEIKRIPGVGNAVLFGGSKDYSMRVWLNPSKMAAYKVTPAEVNSAIQDKNLEAAPGKFGEESNEKFEYVIKYKGKYTRPEEYANIPIRANSDGSILRLKDIARVELGAYSYSNLSFLNGREGETIMIYQLKGSNANDIQIQVDKLMAKAAKNFPKGIEYDNFFRRKTALDESIVQVKHTLIEAFVLVFIVVLIFLQDFRSTLIPAIAVPVAIIGTFFFMNLFGLAINLLTLFAMILAIGIVVDDAIVVVEAVHSKMEHERLKPRAATLAAMHEIGGAIISITLVMMAVFLPVGFMSGSTGIFYRQFAFTMAIAIGISAINALTLSPALAALFLKNTHTDDIGEKPKTFTQKFSVGFNAAFGKITNTYVNHVTFLLKHKWLGIAGLGLVTVFAVYLVKNTKSGFIPTEDQNFLAVAVNMPSGTSLNTTRDVMHQADKVLSTIPATHMLATIDGWNLVTNSTSSSSAALFFLLKPQKERGAVRDIDALQDLMRQKLSTIKQGTFFVFAFPTVPGFSNVEALDMVLQDKTGGTLSNFSKIANDFIGKLNKRKEVAFAFTQFKTDYPQYLLEIDDDKAAQLGVSVRDVFQSMQTYFGSAQASDLSRFGKYYRVMVQADVPNRADPSSIAQVYVKNNIGQMVPIKTLIKLTRTYGSETASRYNLFNSIEINAIPKPGFSSGDVIKAIEETAKEELPTGFNYEWTGQTREEISAGDQAIVVFALSLIFIYFLLAAQYESYLLPFAVLLSIPTGVAGVFAALHFTDISNNIYVQVALIMLIGLLSKNAILIVEFAHQRRMHGEPLVEAAIKAAKQRLRPIVMTSLAFLVGIIPMIFAEGPSAQGNHSISIAAAGGMTLGVALGLLIIPVLFVIFQHLQEKIRGPINADHDEAVIEDEHSNHIQPVVLN
ncbi:efflux RND transporter permease subunit [Mucilaginibacter sp. SG564]|uniref:efflux RND transporter permease subunit n=1 Tax=Mucilaginibacter sp. SG564 TaxID=2587022 RepID=UPI001554BCA9|nr:efflux RND transporter permease subunit [Mucilaginibacter sp. SG564]NOW96030.1 HAE1 family hydrophobic/amphiphilic exporter-1 [Mucilaginibacter sp. SG564]